MNSAVLRGSISAFFTGLLVLLAGCSSGPQYTRDFKPDATFQEYRTYQWRQVSSEVTGVNQERVQSLVDNQLSRQGLRKVGEDADILVDLHLFLQTSSAPSTGIGIGIGLPVGRHGSIGLGSGQLLNRSKLAGTIVVDFTDQKSNALLWRGSANNVAVKNLAVENQQQLAVVIEKLLQQYPPK